MSLSRRSLLTSAAAGAGALAMPSITQAQGARELRFMPHADPISLDPVWTTADITRNHGNLVYDQLFGVDEDFRPHPQMVGGVNTSADGKIWELTLRDGLKFHDGEPVRAIDCVTSIRRWWARDSYGTVLQARTDEISAVNDKTIRIRLKAPFGLLPEALAEFIGQQPRVRVQRAAGREADDDLHRLGGEGLREAAAGCGQQQTGQREAACGSGGHADFLSRVDVCQPAILRHPGRAAAPGSPCRARRSLT